LKKHYGGPLRGVIAAASLKPRDFSLRLFPPIISPRRNCRGLIEAEQTPLPRRSILDSPRRNCRGLIEAGNDRVGEDEVAGGSPRRNCRGLIEALYSHGNGRLSSGGLSAAQLPRPHWTGLAGSRPAELGLADEFPAGSSTLTNLSNSDYSGN
jgi:hypothetical protein